MDPIQYPAPLVPYSGYSSIYFAPEWRIRSTFNLLGFEDRGALELEQRRVVFTGMRVLVDCANVVNITMVRGAIPWPLAPLAMLALVVMTHQVGSFAGLSVSNPLTYPALLLFSGILFAVNWKRWVQVEYLDPAGVSRFAYFRSEAIFIPSFRGTHRLQEDMMTKILEG